MMTKWARAGLLCCFGGLLVACTQGTPGAPITPTGVGVAGAKPVTFTITVDSAAFSNKKQIGVRIWDSTQLAIATETAGCSVSHDVQTGQDKTSCPPGVTFRESTPEETFVSREDLAKGLTILSKTVVVGERYRLSVSGMAADDCNTASASTEGVAGTEAVKVAKLAIAQTEMACIPNR